MTIITAKTVKYYSQNCLFQFKDTKGKLWYSIEGKRDGNINDFNVSINSKENIEIMVFKCNYFKSKGRPFTLNLGKAEQTETVGVI